VCINIVKQDYDALCLLLTCKTTNTEEKKKANTAKMQIQWTLMPFKYCIQNDSIALFSVEMPIFGQLLAVYFIF